MSEEVTDALLRDARVIECHVSGLVAYVVIDKHTVADELVRHYEAQFPGIGIVPITGLPYRPDGSMDASALEPLVDSSRVRGLEQDGVRVAIVTRPALRREQRALVERAPYGGERPSLVERPALELRGLPPTLPQALRDASERSPDRGLVLVGHNGTTTRVSYAELLRRAERGSGALSQVLELGEPVVLQFADDEQLLTAFWTVVLAGGAPIIAPAPTDYRQPSRALERLVPALDALGAATVLTSRARRADLAALVTTARVLAIEDLDTGDVPRRDPRPTDPAVMLLTSGSTGVSKCIVLAHENVMTTIAGNIVDLENTADDVILTWAPMDHVGSLIHMIRAVCLGTTAVIVRPEYVVADPLRWLDLISAHRATNTWGPSFAYKHVVERMNATAAAPRDWDLRCLRVMINAGEQVAVSVAREFCQALEPHGFSPRALKPAFGMAELGSGVTHAHAFDPIAGGGVYRLDRAQLASGRAVPARADDEHPVTLCGLGGPIPGAAMRVVDAEGAVVVEGTIGRVQFAGKNVMRGYHRNDAATAAVFQPDGWFDSGDLGFLHAGELVITGREKEIIIVRGNNLLCHDIEATATVAGVLPTWVAAVGVSGPDAEERLAVFFVPDGGDEGATAERIREAVAQHLGVAADFVVPVARDEFPRTDSGKLQRRELRRRFEEGGFGDLASQLSTAPPSLFARVEWLPDRLDRPALAAARFSLSGTAPAGLEAELRARGHAVEPDGDEVVVFADDPRAVVEAVTRGKATRFTVVTRGCRPDDGAPADPTCAVLPGLLRSAARESGAVIRHVDLPRDGVTVAQLAAELARTDRNDAVCLRPRGRLLRRFSYCHPDEHAPGLASDARCVITGGLGGIGFVLCRWLLARYQARLLVVGRTQRAELDALRRDRLHALEQLGDVEYAAADVADAPALATAVARAEQRWGGHADWLFQLAATLADRPLSETTWDEVATELRPKVAGAIALRQLLEPRPAATLVLFSSVTGAFGAPLNPAYAAACSFEELFAGDRVRCLVWSMWRHIGMSSRSHSEVATRQGYVPLSAETALDALDTALRGRDAVLLVGVDLGAQALGAVARADTFTQHVVVTSADADAAQRVAARVRTELGLRVVVRQEAAPVASAAGEVSPMEAQLAELWQEVLGLETVPRDRGFFALGGNSLRLMILVDLIEQTFGVELAPEVLFANPTLGALVEHVERAPRSGQSS